MGWEGCEVACLRDILWVSLCCGKGGVGVISMGWAGGGLLREWIVVDGVRRIIEALF